MTSPVTIKRHLGAVRRYCVKNGASRSILEKCDCLLTWIDLMEVAAMIAKQRKGKRCKR